MSDDNKLYRLTRFSAADALHRKRMASAGPMASEAERVSYHQCCLDSGLGPGFDYDEGFAAYQLGEAGRAALVQRLRDGSSFGVPPSSTNPHVGHITVNELTPEEFRAKHGAA